MWRSCNQTGDGQEFANEYTQHSFSKALNHRGRAMKSTLPPRTPSFIVERKQNGQAAGKLLSPGKIPRLDMEFLSTLINGGRGEIGIVNDIANATSYVLTNFCPSPVDNGCLEWYCLMYTQAAGRRSAAIGGGRWRMVSLLKSISECILCLKLSARITLKQARTRCWGRMPIARS